ncbi:uncharacterized protein A4U43_C03F32130 [Asparagus officinalis]|uniref:Subtilisin-like protease fibronectin type-III domain-containing protein n=2 Tax=Asparagus officinalis TaxID=4686 RepID=A0A5P1FEK1_ASPOF|nr:uncharacterized protein A4U43_C03F32130 [Asparagus officinalis]
MRMMRLVDGRRFFSSGSCSLEQWNGRKMPPAAVVLCFSTVLQVPSTVAAISVWRLNASALIFAEPSTRLMPQDDLLPTVHVDLIQATQILNYIKSSNNPTIDVFPSKWRLGRSPAPSVAYFSSRGPSSVFPSILKPDIAAPGVNILAAWSPKAPPTLIPRLDNRSVAWNFQSGTSMSCPHVAGVVALLKSAHPHWSPAAIRSALMTTAVMADTSSDTILAGGTLKAADPFDIGAGHMDPLKAMDPGLIYDMDTQDYILFLCSIGYTEAQIRKIVLPNISPININTSCSEVYSDPDLNYPAIVISDLHTALTVQRTVTNVGSGAAIYFARVVSPQGVHVSISPHCLVFFGEGEKISYEVTVIPLKRSGGRYDFGEIAWSDGYHRVRIPLVVRVSTHFAIGGGSESDEAGITNYIQLQ